MRPLFHYKAWPHLIAKDINQALVRRFSYGPEKHIRFVAGIQRSGTNMMMNVIEHHPDTYVYKESDPRAFDDFMMRPIPVIERLINDTIPPYVIIKALHEAHELDVMLDYFEGSRAIWMHRDFRDVVNSNQRAFDNTRNYIDEIVKDPRRGFWRGRGMTDETLRIVREHYSAEMDNISAQALFWYYRTRLFFDQNFETDDRVWPIKYEDFVTRPELFANALAQFIGADPKAHSLVDIVHASSIRKNEPPRIQTDIAELCEAQSERMSEICEQKMKNFAAAEHGPRS